MVMKSHSMLESVEFEMDRGLLCYSSTSALPLLSYLRIDLSLDVPIHPSFLLTGNTWNECKCSTHNKFHIACSYIKGSKSHFLVLCWQFKGNPMDSIVDSLNNAYKEFVTAAANVLEAKEMSSGQKTAATDTALENFKQRWELFRVACDQAEEFVESVKQRIGSECLVDEATGSVTGKSGQSGTTSLPPISAVRLEQMSKAVRWLVIELQHGGSGGSSMHTTNPSAPFDARFSEDAAQ